MESKSIKNIFKGENYIIDMRSIFAVTREPNNHRHENPTLEWITIWINGNIKEEHIKVYGNFNELADAWMDWKNSHEY